MRTFTPHTPRSRWRHLLVVHGAWMLCPLRSRLRCPECGAVGTWKPHGGWLERRGDARPRDARRWLCKWCGHYEGPEGITVAICDTERKVWAFLHEFPDGTTPQAVLRENLGKTNPWNG